MMRYNVTIKTATRDVHFHGEMGGGGGCQKSPHGTFFSKRHVNKNVKKTLKLFYNIFDTKICFGRTPIIPYP
jgi:hypothetical protein